MTDIVQKLDLATIANTIETNINAYLLSFARLPGARLNDDGQVVWLDSGLADPNFNSVVHANLTPETAGSAIEAVLSHFRQRSLPLTWHIGPSTQPRDLDRFLLSHGMEHSEDEPGMAVEIERMRDDFQAPPGLVIEQAQKEDDLETWISIWGCGAPEVVGRFWLDAFRQMGSGDDLSWRYFVGRLDGRPVATSKLFIGAGVAAVHHVVTLPEMRRQGIGTAMTLRVLDEAHAMGYRVAVLTASPDGIGSYRRIGFQEYCQFRRFVR
jgi:GNAT superfamily N-acetyltransferase